MPNSPIKVQCRRHARGHMAQTLKPETPLTLHASCHYTLDLLLLAPLHHHKDSAMRAPVRRKVIV